MSTLLKRGSKGAAVRELQSLLIKAGHPLPKFGADGDFGAETEAAVRALQARLELYVDGIYGPQTRTALKQLLEPVKPGRVEPDKSAMQDSTPAVQQPSGSAAPPSNVASLKLLDTSRAIDEIIVHCAATPEGKDFTVADIRAWHKQRGFVDVGYHYVVYRDGRVLLGRPVGQQGAHCADAGKNRGTIGICYIGGVAADGKTAKDTRTSAQRSSLLWLTQQLATKHKVKRVTGHNQYAAKACPSFDVAKDALGKIAA